MDFQKLYFHKSNKSPSQSNQNQNIFRALEIFQGLAKIWEASIQEK